MTGFTIHRFIEERGQGAAGVRGVRTFVYANKIQLFLTDGNGIVP